MKRRKKIDPSLSSEMISAVIDKIAREINPEKIILFGSYADRTAGANSDLDLMIVVKDSDLPKHKRGRPIRKLLWNMINIPTDILVYTKQEIEDWKTIDGSFIATVLKNGIELYENKT